MKRLLLALTIVAGFGLSGMTSAEAADVHHYQHGYSHQGYSGHGYGGHVDSRHGYFPLGHVRGGFVGNSYGLGGHHYRRAYPTLAYGHGYSGSGYGYGHGSGIRISTPHFGFRIGH